MARNMRRQGTSKDEIPFIPLMTEDDTQFEYQRQPARSSWPRWMLISSICFFAAGLASLAISAAIFIQLHTEDNPLRQMTYFSSVTNSLKPSWFPDQFLTHPLHAPESILRQPPSDEVDAEWKRLTDFGVLTISADDVRGLGKDPASVVRAPADWHRGDDAYLAQLNGVHLLHCLDSMRKGLFHNFGHYHPHGVEKVVYQSHLSHCQEALAKHLMCQPSVELITYSWVERQVQPFPDFDITRKCWDYETLLEWQMEHRVTELNTHKWRALRPEEGDRMLPIPLLMLEAMNVTREEAEHMP